MISTHAPAGGATACYHLFRRQGFNFYSRPCGRGDTRRSSKVDGSTFISTHAPAGGATITMYGDIYEQQPFLLTPLREGRPTWLLVLRNETNEHFYSRPCGRGDIENNVVCTVWLYFYSRPCGRGDTTSFALPNILILFLLTPLREGRLSTITTVTAFTLFLLTPLREGRPEARSPHHQTLYFYSRPCGRGDEHVPVAYS